MKKKSYLLGSVLVLALFARGLANNQLAYAEDSQTESSQVTTVVDTGDTNSLEAGEEVTTPSSMALDYLPATLQGTWENDYESDGISYNVRLIVSNTGLFIRIKTDDQDSIDDIKVGNISQLAEGVYGFDVTSAYSQLNDVAIIGGVDYSQLKGLVLEDGKLYLQFASDFSADNWSKDSAFSSIDLSNVDYKTIDFPKELVGTWQTTVSWGGNQDVLETYVISKDGKVSKRFVDQKAGIDLSEDMTLSKVQQVGDNLYRLVDPEGSFLEAGIGGYGIQYQEGFYLDGDVMKIALWSSSEFDKMTYDNPTFGSEFKRVSADEQTTEQQNQSDSNTQRSTTSSSNQTPSNTQTSSSPSSTQSSSSTTKKEGKTTNLPSTGERASILGVVGLVILVGVGLYLVKKKKDS
ncbi:LPXTG cell wall anchor domain-containing protein [Streptococcus saliviloxodontae]|uniref:LPXTG-motif cell wall-anchored protein n=1 Tax=Streptococcus saliviloxodontae TaxID=1349416 RepID=A0ABS2PNK1_9STRE|nr:LPXTG cell wall anchor domain-containing protein [Streptococcus saliviloxodontae]MBM7636956.1 LPXTG-motif cell wall-anchored protein [Streptococcus saliviloxodontae]